MRKPWKNQEVEIDLSFGLVISVCFQCPVSTIFRYNYIHLIAHAAMLTSFILLSG